MGLAFRQKDPFDDLMGCTISVYNNNIPTFAPQYHYDRLTRPFHVSVTICYVRMHVCVAERSSA